MTRGQEFEAKVRELIRAAGELSPEARRRIIALLEEARKQIVAELAGLDPQNYTAMQRQALRNSIDNALEHFRSGAISALEREEEIAFRLGQQMVDGPLRAGVDFSPFGGVSRATLAIAQDYTADLVGGLSREMAARLNTALQRAFLGGQSLTDIIAQVGRAIGGNKFTGLFSPLGERAKTIATNEILRVHSMAAQARLEDVVGHVRGLKKRWHWVNLGQVPRQTHRDIDGQVKDVDEPFEVPDPVSGEIEELMFPRDPAGSASNTINCLPGETIVQGRFCKALKAWYTGPMVEIHRRHGDSLACTANHRVLTTRGWVSAKEIREGDKLLCYRPVIPLFALPDANEQNPPSSIEDIFHALRLYAASRDVNVSDDQLRGDAKFGNGKVEIVNPDWELLHEEESAGGKNKSQFPFVRANSVLMEKHGDGPALFSFNRISTPSACGPSFTQQRFGPLAVLDQDPPSIGLAFGPASQLDAISPEKRRQGASAHAEFLRELIKAGSGKVFVDEVTRIIRSEWSGHVYDAETATGWMVADGILASNCHCLLLPHLEPEALKSTPADRSLLRDLGIEISVS
jgi:hypothetical protein